MGESPYFYSFLITLRQRKTPLHFINTFVPTVLSSNLDKTWMSEGIDG